MRLKLAAFVVCVFFLLLACEYELPLSDDDGDFAIVPGTACHPDSVYFSNTILPIISSGCAVSGCHDAGTREEGLVLNTYSGIRQLVLPGNASQSTLYKVISTRDPNRIMPPAPHTPFSASTIANIARWINQGAKNNYCNAGCDTTQIGWTTTIAPIIDTYCKGCHNAASTGGGIDLGTYAGVRAAAMNGKLLGSILQEPGFAPMPEKGSMLDECQLRQIEKWIESGMPAN